MRWRGIVKRHLSPAALERLRFIYQGIRFGGVEWELSPEGWAAEADPAVKGWDLEGIAQAQIKKWPEFLRLLSGAAPLTIAHESPVPRADDYDAHHLNMAYAYVLGIAARNKASISVLDWGGGIGHYLALSRSLFPDLTINYYCKDVPALCRAGRRLLTDAVFMESDDEVAGRTYDLAVASASLQYSKDWRATIQSLALTCTGYLYVTRLPVVFQVPSFVVRQRAYEYGYNTEYLSWVFNRDEFLDGSMRMPLQLVREFVFAKHPAIKKAREEPEIRGFLFRPVDAP
jgi:putative methyltransferase (TIGR04325 family)